MIQRNHATLLALALLLASCQKQTHGVADLITRVQATESALYVTFEGYYRIKMQRIADDYQSGYITQQQARDAKTRMDGIATEVGRSLMRIQAGKKLLASLLDLARAKPDDPLLAAQIAKAQDELIGQLGHVQNLVDSSSPDHAGEIQ